MSKMTVEEIWELRKRYGVTGYKIYRETAIPLCDTALNLYAEREELRSEYSKINELNNDFVRENERLKRELSGDCPYCGNVGWYEGEDPASGEPMQIQCQWCDETPYSKFNIARVKEDDK